MAILNPFRIGQGVLGRQLGPYPYGVLNAGQVPYWDGNEFKIPSFMPQPWVYMPPAQQGLPSSSMDPQSNPNAGILAAMMNAGDGGAGNGVGGGPAAPGATAGTADFSESGHVNAPDPTTAAVAANAGVPSLPDFKENTAPSAPTAPATGMPVGEVDPQGPSGATKGTAQAANPASAAMGMTNRSAVDKGLAEDQAAAAIGKASTAFTDAIAGLAISSQALNAQESSDIGSRAGIGAENAGAAGVPGSSQNAPGAVTGQISTAKSDFISPSRQAEINAAIAAAQAAADAGNSNGTQGGIGATGNPGPGNDTSGTAAADAGGSWRKGGFVGDDGDKKLEPVRGILHEREFVLTPEVTAAIQKKSPGLLNRLAKMQKMMAA